MAMTEKEIKAYEDRRDAEEKAKKIARPFDVARAMAAKLGSIYLGQTEVPGESFYLGTINGYFAPDHERAAEILKQALIKIGSVETDTHVFVPEGKDSEDRLSVDVQTSLKEIPTQQLLQAIQEIHNEQSKQLGTKT